MGQPQSVPSGKAIPPVSNSIPGKVRQAASPSGGSPLHLPPMAASSSRKSPFVSSNSTDHKVESSQLTNKAAELARHDVESTRATNLSPADGRAEGSRRVSLTTSADDASPGGGRRASKFGPLLERETVDIEKLRDVAWSGVPTESRALVWKLLLGCSAVQQTRRDAVVQRLRREYQDCVPRVLEADRGEYEEGQHRQISVDMPRTNPNVQLFQDERVQQCLLRLLFVWAMRHPGTGYVQGMNDLATPFFCVLLCDAVGCTDIPETSEGISDEILNHVEADTYHCLSRLLDAVQDHYTFAQKGIQKKVFELRRLTRRVDSALVEHLEEIGIDFLQFSFRWMNCLLMRELNMPCVLRLWDTYISEGDKFPDFHVYVCAAFLQHWSSEIRAMDFQEAMIALQQPPTQHWQTSELDLLLSQAYAWRHMFKNSQQHLE